MNRAPARGPAASSRRPGRGGRLLRGTAGVLAGGLVVLALVLFAGWLIATRTGSPGPGGGMLIGHGLGAVAAVAGQVVADRRADRMGVLAALGVIVVSAVVLGAYWLA
ncbi:hypothetical protein [Pseudonocardia acidicola]|uniref:Uncharacterized protein n=1 Tax=Pseudonocardia acidicola TaxID=2724939 RepID=A0ABX1S6I0_9PSEU|nr:hypothetical protein [Pseudonocardia acidicola]NMH97163.1 hypothetical protein [Pseudonocardia acidicola]